MEASLPAWTQPYLQTFQKTEYPLLLAGPSLDFLWANAAAEALLSPLSAEEALRRSIFLHHDSTIFDNMSHGDVCSLPFGALLSAGECLLTPVMQGDALAGCTVTFRKSSGGMEGLPLESLERILATFEFQTRNPLNQIFLSLSRIASCDEALEIPGISEYVNQISRQSFLLLRSSTNILERKRYEHGINGWNPKVQDLRSTIEEICPLIFSMLKGIGIRFVYHILLDKPVFTRFDAKRIGVAVLHLVSNAAKFIAENGEITLELSANEKSVMISVTDNGMGISGSLLPHVFDPYFSRDPRTGHLCGDGLGLAICKEIVEQHSGSITLESTEGIGTRVAFSIPIVEDDGATLTLCDSPDATFDYMKNRFSDLWVLLADVCPPPDLAIGRH